MNTLNQYQVKYIIFCLDKLGKVEPLTLKLDIEIYKECVYL